MTEPENNMLKRRQTIETIVGHLKAEHRMNRCHLNCAEGDRLHAVSCAAGYNILWLLLMIAQKGLSLFFRLLQPSHFSDLQRKLRGNFTVNSINSGSMNWVVG